MRTHKSWIAGIALSAVSLAASAQSKVVISQIYGGAGCGTANCSTYKNDYIEIFNAGNVAQNLNGWSIQYSAASGTAWQATNLTNVTLQPGQYYLIAQGAGANGINNIPTPDASGTVAMSATAAKVALVNSTTALSGSCPTGPTIVDLVGYGGTATCNEGGSNAPSPSTTTAAFRAGNGCTDAGVNGTDFSVATPNARNTATAISPCTVLPVTFTSFRAQFQTASSHVAINWSTSQETNAREYIVERSADGTAWTSIARIAATGNTTGIRNYETADLQPLPGTNLYRIRQVDIDGRIAYTGIIGVRNAGRNVYFRVFPSPTEGTVYINAALAASASVRIRVADINGRELLTEQRIYSAAQPLQLDLARFGKGTYFVSLISNGLTATEKVIVY